MSVKRKMFIFKDFGHKFRTPLPTVCEYLMFLPLTKMKHQNIKVVSDKKSVLNLKSKRKLIKLQAAFQIMFISKTVCVEM